MPQLGLDLAEAFVLGNIRGVACGLLVSVDHVPVCQQCLVASAAKRWPGAGCVYGGWGRRGCADLAKVAVGQGRAYAPPVPLVVVGWLLLEWSIQVVSFAQEGCGRDPCVEHCSLQDHTLDVQTVVGFGVAVVAEVCPGTCCLLMVTVS